MVWAYVASLSIITRLATTFDCSTADSAPSGALCAPSRVVLATKLTGTNKAARSSLKWLTATWEIGGWNMEAKPLRSLVYALARVSVSLGSALRGSCWIGHVFVHLRFVCSNQPVANHVTFAAKTAPEASAAAVTIHRYVKRPNGRSHRRQQWLEEQSNHMILLESQLDSNRIWQTRAIHLLAVAIVLSLESCCVYFRVLDGSTYESTRSAAAFACQQKVKIKQYPLLRDKRNMTYWPRERWTLAARVTTSIDSDDSWWIILPLSRITPTQNYLPALDVQKSSPCS